MPVSILFQHTTPILHHGKAVEDAAVEHPGLAGISIYSLVLASGMAALSWEVVWQIRSSLALGISAWGTAATLAVTMGGMCAGALAIGFVFRDKKTWLCS
ncbi:MAG: hypothetical protein ACREDH_01955 [Methylocella sp.]